MERGTLPTVGQTIPEGCHFIEAEYFADIKDDKEGIIVFTDTSNELGIQAGA